MLQCAFEQDVLTKCYGWANLIPLSNNKQWARWHLTDFSEFWIFGVTGLVLFGQMLNINDFSGSFFLK